MLLNTTHAQINVPQDTNRVSLGAIYVSIDTVNIWQLQSLLPDSIMYTTNQKPFFISNLTVKSYIKNNTNIYTNPRWINDIYYEPNNKIVYSILRSGKVVLKQKIDRSKFMLVDKSPDQKIWYWLRYAKINNYPANVLWNYAPLDSIINPPVIVKDTIN